MRQVADKRYLWDETFQYDALILMSFLASTMHIKVKVSKLLCQCFSNINFSTKLHLTLSCIKLPHLVIKVYSVYAILCQQLLKFIYP